MTSILHVNRFFTGLLLLAISGMFLTQMFSQGSLLAVVLTGVLGLALIFFSMTNYRQRLWVCLGITGFLVLLYPGTIAIMARYPELPGLAELLAFALDFLGMPSVSQNGHIFSQSADIPLEYFPSMSRVGAFPILTILLGFGALFILVPIERAWYHLGRIFGIILAYAVLRILVLVAFRQELPANGLETSEWMTLLSFLPAAWLLGSPVALVEPEDDTPATRSLVGRTLLAAILAFSFTLAMGWVDPGVTKQGRILFDDSHGPWEPTDIPFDENQFTQQVSYTYSSLYKMLSWYYPVDRIKTGPISPERLADVDVLIVKTPTTAFTDAEVAAIENFVAHGGGLFAIGDHTNLFGMTTYINKVVRPFGFSFRKDDTFNLIAEAQTIWEAPWLRPHPIARLTDRFEFETSATITAPLISRAPIIGYSMGSELADYTRPGFFGELHLDERDDFGFFIQHGVSYYGEGRVALFSDSTPFSNFSIFFPVERNCF